MGKLSDDNTLLIPGHGTMVHKKDLVPYRNMLRDLTAKTRAMIAQGKTLDDILAANITKPYDANTRGDDAASIKRFVTELYHENTDLPSVMNGRRAMRQ
jgi:hypothetical protein